ncbi:S26 family signal peptidase [Nonomuraea sp. NPDC048826]|uniref:S26 family signal peptidase n=1 Tax=Nonomuraea sp. NPDC048826 TaxID=3364347 RepID=UPI00371AE7E5
MSRVLSLVGVVLGVLGVLGWVRRAVVLVTVEGRSMEPALRHGDRVVVWRRGVGGLRPADVVVLGPPGAVVEVGGVVRSPVAGLQVKRVVGLPGQVVPAELRGVVGSDRVPAGTVLVVSDNRAVGLDSRVWGPYPAGGVVGVVVFRAGAGGGVRFISGAGSGR